MTEKYTIKNNQIYEDGHQMPLLKIVYDLNSYEKTLHSLSEKIIELSLKVAYAEEKGIKFDKDYEEYIGDSEHDV